MLIPKFLDKYDDTFYDSSGITSNREVLNGLNGLNGRFFLKD